MRYYRVFLLETGELLNEGTADECAGQRGITVNSFRNMFYKNQDGSKYRGYQVTVEDIPDAVADTPPEPELTWEEKFARSWDDMRKNFDTDATVKKETTCPCDSCQKRKACMMCGRICDSYGKWYCAEWDKYAAVLRRPKPKTIWKS